MLKTCTDCFPLCLWMPLLTIQVVKLRFRGASQKSMPFLGWLEYFLEILQVSYQIIILYTCQIWKSCNNSNPIKLVKILCCVFNGTQCIWQLSSENKCTQENHPPVGKISQKLSNWNILKLHKNMYWVFYVPQCTCKLEFDYPERQQLGDSKFQILDLHL